MKSKLEYFYVMLGKIMDRKHGMFKKHGIPLQIF